MKKVVFSLIVILLLMPLIPYGEEALTGFIIRAQFTKDNNKFFASSEKYVLLPNQKALEVTLTAKDNFVWKAGWYCKQPCVKSYDWTTFDFKGDIVPNTENLRWMYGKDGRTSVISIPRQHLKNGKNYFAAYTCEGVNKCNGNKWLMLPIEVLILNEVPDLYVSSVYVDLPEKNTGSFFIVIKNSGNIASHSGVLSYKILDLDSEKTIADKWLVMPAVVAGKTGATSRVSFPLGETTKVSISIHLDSKNEIIELNKNNNQYTITKEFNPRYPAPPK